MLRRADGRALPDVALCGIVFQLDLYLARLLPDLRPNRSFPTVTDRAIGLVLIATALAVLVHEWLGYPWAANLAALGALAFLVLATPRARWSRQGFVATGIGLAVIAALTRDDWLALSTAALAQGAFIAAFFIALASLRNPAGTSPAIERCGQYLASQPPGKRYLALTAGGHLFALILSYGSIPLLGGLTESITAREPNREVAEIRNRRMLLAIQRGFVASLTWSPLAFAMAISTSLIPGSSWGGAAVFAIINACIVTFIGWALDTLYKPKLSRPAPQRGKPNGTIRDVQPLLALLLLLFGGVAVLEFLTGLRIIAIVMLLVPIISTGWIIVQSRGDAANASREAGHPGAILRTWFRLGGMATRDIPSFQSELVLLVMAGVIGSLGGALLSPLLAGQAADFSSIPAWLVVAALVWVIPLLGQVGMNPILSVSLLAPLIPSASSMGISPNSVVVALTAGWALAGASSPFTATTLLVGRLGHTTALRVGLVWNGSFMLCAGLALSASVALTTLL